ncbi:MAG: hypothetical protein V4508_12330 [Pseudomonadota bacterium]
MNTSLFNLELDLRRPGRMAALLRSVIARLLGAAPAPAPARPALQLPPGPAAVPPQAESRQSAQLALSAYLFAGQGEKASAQAAAALARLSVTTRRIGALAATLESIAAQANLPEFDAAVRELMALAESSRLHAQQGGALLQQAGTALGCVVQSLRWVNESDQPGAWC